MGNAGVSRKKERLGMRGDQGLGRQAAISFIGKLR